MVEREWWSGNMDRPVCRSWGPGPALLSEARSMPVSTVPSDRCDPSFPIPYSLFPIPVFA